MSFIAILKDNTIENETFRNIQDLNSIKKLICEDVVPVEIDFETGIITLNHQPITRLEALFSPDSKPIQYRKVVEKIGVLDYEKLYETTKVNAPDKLYLFEEAFLRPTDQAYENLNDYCMSVLNNLPTLILEEQVIGYEYSCSNQKVKIEIINNARQNTVMAHITLTNLETKQKKENYMRFI